MNLSTSQLVRYSFARMLAIAVIALVATASAFAQVPNTIPPPGINPGTNVGDQGMFVPHGLVRVPVVDTLGNPIIDPTTGLQRVDYWVADTASGFCRL